MSDFVKPGIIGTAKNPQQQTAQLERDIHDELIKIREILADLTARVERLER